MKNRVTYLDTIRWMAAVFIFTTHFISIFEPKIFTLWDEVFPINMIMYGVTGKLAVTVLSVVLGYLAFSKGEKNSGKMDSVRYLLNRYLYFLAAGLVIHFLYGASAWTSLTPYQISVKAVLECSIFMKNSIVAPWWSMLPFFIGSVLCFIHGKYHVGYREMLIEIAILYYLGQVWIAVCLMGAVAKSLLEDERAAAVIQKKWFRILVFAVLFIFLKREESNLTYLIDGIGMTLFVLVLCTWEKLQKFFGHKYWGIVNKNYMGVFLIHELVYVIVGTWMLNYLQMVPYKLRLLLAYVVCLGIISLLAKVIDWLVKKLYEVMLRGENRIWKTE